MTRIVLTLAACLMWLAMQSQVVPKGTIVSFEHNHSNIYPGTERTVKVYVPQQYAGTKPACLLVCMDGILYDAAAKIDTLISRGDMPVTIGVFVEPGVVRDAAGEVVRMVRAACRKPLMVKLSPQAEDIPAMCRAVEAAGADAISLTNTFQACAIDLEKRRPVFDNIFAGLSGPAVRPIALRMVWQAVGAVSIPVVGLGGIATGRDALEFIMAGAAAVQVGAANFANPRAMSAVAEKMAAWMDAHGVKDLAEIRGCAR